MKSVIFVALALVLPSTAAMASPIRPNAAVGASLSAPVERKAGACTGCACCDYITIAGIRIPVSGMAPAGPSGRD